MGYIEYDNMGLKEVRCMVCNTPVGGRVYVDVPGSKEKAVAFSRYNNWRQPRKVLIMNGDIKSYVEPIVCAECAGKDWDENDIVAKVMDGHEREMVHAGKPRSEIEAYKARHNLRCDKAEKTVIRGDQ